MDAVVAQINRNSDRIPTLWTQLDFTAHLVDPDKNKTTDISGDGGLMYARPMSLLLTGDKDVAGEVFQLGSNDEAFWVKIRSAADAFQYWWGHYANLGKPGCKSIPLRPDQIIEVLGVGLYRTNFLIQPVPVMRFDNDQDAYVFDLNVLNVDRWETREEIWYDREKKWPIRVLLYEADGRVVLKADLSQQTPVQTPGLPRAQWPLIARHYDLYFPDTGSKITFDFLNDPQLQHQGHRKPLPNPGSFERIEPEGNTTVIQIDKDVK
jgi:hypothetical protein